MATIDYTDVPTDEFLKEYGFNDKSINFFFEQKGFKTLNCLQQEFVKNFIEENRLLVIAPTSSGKTTVAMLKIIKILDKPEISKRFIYLLPYSSLLREKFEEFSSDFKQFGLITTQNVGDYQKGDANFLICSFHDMDTYFRYHQELDEPDLFIFDELDVLGNTFFGPVVESTIATFKELGILNSILSITATVGNMELLANWLKNSKILNIDYRPVPLLKEVLCVSKGLDAEVLIDLYKKRPETKDNPILVIRNNKPFVDSLAKNLALKLPTNSIDLTKLRRRFEKNSYYEEIFNCIQHGVGIYHADIPKKIQDFVIKRYGTELPFIIATSSLARGINLKCKTVVIDPYIMGKLMKRSDYEQISGRAGRWGKQKVGYSIIYTKDNAQKTKCEDKFISGDLETLESGYFDGEKFRFLDFELDVLKSITSNPANQEKLSQKYENYYFACGMDENYRQEFLSTNISKAISELKQLNFIEMGKNTYISSDLAKYYIYNQCYAVQNLNLKQFYSLNRNIIQRILEDELEITFPNYYHILRTIVNNLDEESLVQFNRSPKIKKETIVKVDKFITEKCGLLSSQSQYDLTFVILVNYMMGKSLNELEKEYHCQISTINKISKNIPVIINKINKLISTSFSTSGKKEDWINLIRYLKDSIKNGIPIKHLPFRMHIPRRSIPRNIWLEFILRVQLKYKDNPLSSYNEFFNAESNFRFFGGIGKTRNQLILDNVENIRHSESKLSEFLENLDLDFPFRVDAKLPSPGNV